MAIYTSGLLYCATLVKVIQKNKKVNKRKKWAIGLAVFALAVTLICLLPLQSNVKEKVQFAANSEAVFRQLQKDSIWYKWWPGEIEPIGRNKVFINGHFRFVRENILLYTFVFKTTTSSFSTVSKLQLTSESDNVVTASLQSSITIPHNPFNRIKSLFLSTKLKESYKEILSSLSHHFAENKNQYDVDIKELTVPFEYVTTLSDNFSHSPSTAEIYFLIDQVKAYLKSKEATEKGSPMLFTTQEAKGKYFVQVAIPTNKSLPETGKIKSKWMLKGGNILSAQVLGNRQVISNAKQQLDLYIHDHHRSVVAIPYEYLITNRIEQPDSNKWVTRIYFPVI